MQIERGVELAASRAPVNASSMLRIEIRLARSVTHSAGCAPAPKAGRISSRHCSSTGTTQSMSGTVNTVRRFGGLPRDDLPHRTNTPPYRPNAGTSGCAAGQPDPIPTLLAAATRTHRPSSAAPHRASPPVTPCGRDPGSLRPPICRVEQRLDLVVGQRPPARVALVLADMHDGVPLVQKLHGATPNRRRHSAGQP